MTRAERAKKRARANLHYARVTLYAASVFFGTFILHLTGDAARGSCQFGGELLLPLLGIGMYQVYKYCEEAKKC